MNNFVFFPATKYVFGRGVENKVAEQLEVFGMKKPLIVFGKGSVVRSGLLDRVGKSLEDAGIPFAELGGVQPNPVDSKVYEGIEIAKKEGIDSVLAVGGGSSIDTAKAIAAAIPYDGDFWDFYCGKAKVKKALPVGILRDVIRIVMASICIIASSILTAGSVYSKNNLSGEALIHECKALSDKFDYSGLRKVAIELIEAGNQEHNERIEGYGYLYLSGAQLMLKEASLAIKNMQMALSIGEQLKNDTILSVAYNSLGIYEASVTRNLNLAQRYFFKSRKYAREARYSRIERSIGSNLAELSIELKDTAGIYYAKECYNYGIEEGLPRYEYSGALNLAELYNIQGNNDLAERYVSIAMALASEHGYQDKGQLFLIRGIIALGKSNYNLAKEFALKAVEALQEENTRSLPKAYLLLASAYRGQGKYDESMIQLKHGADAAHKYSSFTSIAEIYELMADNYESMGRSLDALRFLRMAKDSVDTNYKNEKVRMDNERSLIIDLEEKENNIRLQNLRVKSQRRMIMSLTVVICLLILLIAYITYSIKKRKKLYEYLVERNQKVVAMRDDILHFSLNQKNDEEVETMTPINDIKSDELYASLCRMMKEERLYADPRITREYIIERLGTNRTYLTKIISKYGWINYSQFVNSFRIDEAIRILSNKTNNDKKISSLYSELGFGSPATFFKTFSKVTGMSPAAFRKSVK